MASFLYKDRLIVISAIHDETNRSWIPFADISWGTDGDRGSHKITSPPNHFKNWPDAETNMLELAKAGIDDHA
jgi:hypothetical protein